METDVKVRRERTRIRDTALAPNAEFTTKPPRGRPMIAIDHRVFEGLALIHCTLKEAASVMGCHEATLARRMEDDPELREIWERGKDKGRMSIRRQLFEHSKLKNSAGVKACEILSVHILGWTPTHAMEHAKDQNAQPTTARERVTTRVESLSERIRSGIVGLAAAAGAKTSSQKPE